VLQDIAECNSERPILQEQDNVRLKKCWISEGKKEKGKTNQLLSSCSAQIPGEKLSCSW